MKFPWFFEEQQAVAGNKSLYFSPKPNQATILKLITEPRFCLQFWFAHEGKRKKINSLLIKPNGEETGATCPIVNYFLEHFGQTPIRTAIVGIYNIPLSWAQIWHINQQQILRQLDELNQESEERGENFLSHALQIVRRDGEKGRIYHLKPIENYKLKPTDKKIIARSKNIIADLVEREVAKPTQKVIDQLGLPIKLPRIEPSPDPDLNNCFGEEDSEQ